MLSLQGAEAPLSGLIAMLAAAEILGNSSHAEGYERCLVFAGLAGEPWGYMGSKRFLWELHRGNNSTKPLSLLAIDQVGACSAKSTWRACTSFSDRIPTLLHHSLLPLLSSVKKATSFDTETGEWHCRNGAYFNTGVLQEGPVF